MHRHTVRALAVALVLVSAGAARAAVQVSVKGSTTRIAQTSSGGAIVIANAETFGDWTVSENGGVVATFVASKNVVVEMLSSASDPLQVDLANALPGKLTLVLGDATRLVEFTGLVNVVGGNVKITAGEGEQVIELAVNSNLTVGGDLVIDLGGGDDRIDADSNSVVVLDDMTLRGVNEFENDGNSTVAGDLRFDVSDEAIQSMLDNDEDLLIGGDVEYRGNDNADTALLNSGVRIDGDLDIDLGDGNSMLNQTADLDSMKVLGDVSVRSGPSLSGTIFDSTASTSFEGDVDVSFGTGSNECNFFGSWDSEEFRYTGAGGQDSVVLGLDAPDADVQIRLKGGADEFTLEASTIVNELFVDFGSGTDTFTDNLGEPYPFDVELKNLP